MEINFGSYALPFVLSIILSITYKMVGENLPDRFKSAIAIAIGIGLGVLAIPYSNQAWSLQNIVDYTLHGCIQGAAAVGIYEVARSAYRPRE